MNLGGDGCLSRRIAGVLIDEESEEGESVFLDILRMTTLLLKCKVCARVLSFLDMHMMSQKLEM